jgi:hypothetical protein
MFCLVFNCPRSREELIKAKDNLLRAELALKSSEDAELETENNKRCSRRRLESIIENVASIKQKKRDLADMKTKINNSLPVINRIENSVKVSKINLGIYYFTRL